MSSDDEVIPIADEGSIENQLEQVESNLDVVEQVEADTNADQAEDEESKKVVKPKRVVRNPQPKLDANTLRKPKGLSAVQGYFERVKFKGRGHEEQDLNTLMKTYEYWCHRLFPKFPFDACIAKLETLGTKRATIAQINRIRMDLDIEEDKPLESDQEQIPTDGFVDATSDSQVTSTPQVTQEQIERNSLFNQLLPSTSTSTSHITDEQLERIRQNKERAERLRREKLNKINEKAANHLEASRSLSIDNSEKESNANEELPSLKDKYQLRINEGESSQTDEDAVKIDERLSRQNKELASVIPLTDIQHPEKGNKNTKDNYIYQDINENGEVNVDNISEINGEDAIDNILDEINKDDSDGDENPIYEMVPVIGDSDQEIMNEKSASVEIVKDTICIDAKTVEGENVDVNLNSKVRTKTIAAVLDSDEDLEAADQITDKDDMDVDLESANSIRKRRNIQRIESDDEDSL